MPPKYDCYWKRWQLLHPNWEFKDWRDLDIQKLSLHSTIQQATINAAKADIARYEILYLHGGIYLDCDMDCYQPIDALIHETDEFVICNQIEDLRCICSMGFFASMPSHPILKSALREIRETEIELINSLSTAEVTGPYFFRRIINNRKVKVLAPHTFYPYFHLKSEWYQQDLSKVYAVHDWNGSWLSASTLLELATKQFRRGDLSSCLDTCKKGESATKLQSETDSQLRNFNFLSRLCKAKIFAHIAIFFPLIQIIVLPTYKVYAYLVKKQKLHLKEQVIKKLYRGHLKIWHKFSKFISIESSALQYNHLIDFLLSNRESDSLVRILEIGAMDGKSFDSLYPYLKTASNLEVLFVEPLEEMMMELKENYKGYEKQSNKFLFENSAVTEEEGYFEIYTIPKQTVSLENLPEWAKGISTLLPEKTIMGKGGFSANNEKQSLQCFSTQRKVKGMTLRNILGKYELKTFDILQIDTEGFDFRILKQALSLIHPQIICFEWVNLDDNEKEEAISQLIAKKYSVVLSANACDCIAFTYELWAKLAYQVFCDHSVILFPPFI